MIHSMPHLRQLISKSSCHVRGFGEPDQVLSPWNVDEIPKPLHPRRLPRKNRRGPVYCLTTVPKLCCLIPSFAFMEDTIFFEQEHQPRCTFYPYLVEFHMPDLLLCGIVFEFWFLCYGFLADGHRVKFQFLTRGLTLWPTFSAFGSSKIVSQRSINESPTKNQIAPWPATTYQTMCEAYYHPQTTRSTLN